MDNNTKTQIDEFFKEMKEKLHLENIKKQIEPFSEDAQALEYFEDRLEDLNYLVEDAEEFIGTTILNLDEDK